MSAAERASRHGRRCHLILKHAEYAVCWIDGNTVTYIDGEGKIQHDVFINSSVVKCTALD